MISQQRKLDSYFPLLRSSKKEKVNYLKMNQGYDNEDVEDPESSFTDNGHQVSKRSNKIRKVNNNKNKSHKQYNSNNNGKEKQYVRDNLEILLSWKKAIKLKSYETNKSYVNSVKSICDADLSKMGSNIQGIFINIRWQNQHNKDGISISQFEQIQLSKKLISNGIVFIWSEKSLLSEIIEAMDHKGFIYIENFVSVNLSANIAYDELKKIKPHMTTQASKADAVLANLSVLQDRIQVKDMLEKSEYKYLSNAKRTLLMFRKSDKTQLELRHQRTSDVLFDLVDDDGYLSKTTREYVYQLIETLLPKASDYKLVELWGDAAQPRKGWVTVAE